MNIGIVIGLIKALAPGVDPEIIEQAVTDWLDDHPEATTTVQDGSITEAKLAQDVLEELGEIDGLKEAIVPLTPAATSGDVGKFLKAKTVSGGKVTEYEFGSASGGAVTVDDELSNSSTNPVQNKVITGALAQKADKVATGVPVEWVDKTWINNSGVAEADNDYEATDYIDLDGIFALAYTGKTGSSNAVFWYNSSKTFISGSLPLNDRMAWFEDIVHYRPEGAAYVRIQSKKMTATNPPDMTPEVTAYPDAKSVEALKDNIVGDGTTDDTLAVQKIVNMGDSVVFPQRDTILISDPIHIQLGHARIIDGNGCNIVVDDDFCALSITGTLATASEATGMNAFVVAHEACAMIKNFRITAEDITEGCGIELTKGFKTKLCNNYIHHMKNGIRVYGRNREIIISENNVFAMVESGILFDSGINLHQCNIANNMLQYAHDVIFVDEPDGIANFQIVGNDIEIVDYPSSTYTTATCIHLKSVSTCTQFSEIEITGNTVQGHNTSVYAILMTGVDDHEIKHVTISGNHIGNSQGAAIDMAYVKSITIAGNNYTSCVGYVYQFDGECTNVMISGESADNVAGKVKAKSTATLNGIKCKNVRFLTNDQNSILTSNATDVDIYDEKDITVSGSTPSITAVPNARYICGEVSTLSFTPCASGACAVVFTSGSTPTTLTVPSGLKWADSFDPTDLDASTTYEISVLNGTLGVAAKWA